MCDYGVFSALGLNFPTFIFGVWFFSLASYYWLAKAHVWQNKFCIFN